ncbi:hypothetical protein AB0A67_34355, partial [Streptomyces eurythermus]
HPKIAALGPAELHRRQIRWYAEWAADFQAFLRRRGEADARPARRARAAFRRLKASDSGRSAAGGREP